VNEAINTLDIKDQASKENFKKIKKHMDDLQEQLDSEDWLNEQF